MRLHKSLVSILLWSVISAAFIGPGTVTTAAKAGASQGLSLVWALTFSTIGCLVLQEAAARLAIVSKRSLGQALRMGKLPVVFAVVFGCMAYEAGNMLGAYAGLSLFWDIPQWVVMLILGAIAALLLGFGRADTIAKTMGVGVLLLGFAFLWLSFRTPIEYTALLQGLVVPSFPEGSSLLIIGLIGTTIVPYNLFLGSNLGGNGQTVGTMRLGLSISVLLGGIFSIAILVVGSGLSSEFTFEMLAQHLEAELGSSGRYLLGIGLFIAGLTSTLTAPLAAALAIRAILPESNFKRERNYRYTWMLVLAVGVLVGSLKLEIVPVIILAQALNGFVLPFVASFLMWAVNQPHYLGDRMNSLGGNLLFSVVLAVCIFLGIDSLLKALDSTFQTAVRQHEATPLVLMGVAIIFTGLIAWMATSRRRSMR